MVSFEGRKGRGADQLLLMGEGGRKGEEGGILEDSLKLFKILVTLFFVFFFCYEVSEDA